MKYQVRWVQSALDDLMNHWTASDSVTRSRITIAAHSLDQKFEQNPYGFGESRNAGERVYFVDPVGALVEIDDATKTVWVLCVWLF